MEQLLLLRKRMKRIKRRKQKTGEHIWMKMNNHHDGSHANETNKYEMNLAQWNIALMHNGIEMGPDQSLNCFYLIIATDTKVRQHNAMKIQKIKYEMQEKPKLNVNTEYLKKLSDKTKYIKKKTINKSMIIRIVNHIHSNPKKQRLMLLKEVLTALHHGYSFNVQKDYLSQALSQKQLNNPIFVIKILQSRDAEWMRRVQTMEYIESNIGINGSLKSLFEDDNSVNQLIVGWMTQLYDERSRVTQT
eukprot:306057_1